MCGNTPVCPVAGWSCHARFVSLRVTIHSKTLPLKGEDCPLRGTGVRREEFLPVHDARLEPGLNGLLQGRKGVQLSQEGLVVQAIEAFFDVGIQDEFVLLGDAGMNRVDRIVARASWAKAIAIGFSRVGTVTPRLRRMRVPPSEPCGRRLPHTALHLFRTQIISKMVTSLHGADRGIPHITPSFFCVWRS